MGSGSGWRSERAGGGGRRRHLSLYGARRAGGTAAAAARLSGSTATEPGHVGRAAPPAAAQVHLHPRTLAPLLPPPASASPPAPSASVECTLLQSVCLILLMLIKKYIHFVRRQMRFTFF